MGIVEKLIEWFCLKTGYRFCYELTLYYFPYPGDGNYSIENNALAYFTSKNHILNRKAVKRLYQHWIYDLVKDQGVKADGHFKIQIRCYLGLLKKY